MSMQGYNSSHSGEELDESIDRYGDISKNLTVFKNTLKELSDKVSGKVISIGAGDSTHDFGLNSAIKNLLVKGANGITTYLQTNADGTTYSLVIDASLVQSGATEEEIKAIIEKWLKEHPEATTTVADGSITLAKLSTGLKNLIQSADSGSKVEIYISEEEVSDTYINYEYGVRLRNSKNEIISQYVDSLKITGATSTTAGLMTAVQVRNLASAISSITTLRNDLNWLNNKVQDIEEKGGGYQKPSTGIPASDLSQEVQNKLNNPAFPEAPTDGKTYGRKNGAWTEISEQAYTALAKKYADDAEGSSVAAQEAADNAFSHSEQARQSMDEAKAAKNAIDATLAEIASQGESEVIAAQGVQLNKLESTINGGEKVIDIVGSEYWVDGQFMQASSGKYYIISNAYYRLTKAISVRTGDIVRNYGSNNATNSIYFNKTGLDTDKDYTQVGGAAAQDKTWTATGNGYVRLLSYKSGTSRGTLTTEVQSKFEEIEEKVEEKLNAVVPKTHGKIIEPDLGWIKGEFYLNSGSKETRYTNRGRSVVFPITKGTYKLLFSENTADLHTSVGGNPLFLFNDEEGTSLKKTFTASEIKELIEINEDCYCCINTNDSRSRLMGVEDSIMSKLIDDILKERTWTETKYREYINANGLHYCTETQNYFSIIETKINKGCKYAFYCRENGAPKIAYKNKEGEILLAKNVSGYKGYIDTDIEDAYSFVFAGESYGTYVRIVEIPDFATAFSNLRDRVFDIESEEKTFEKVNRIFLDVDKLDKVAINEGWEDSEEGIVCNNVSSNRLIFKNPTSIRDMSYRFDVEVGADSSFSIGGTRANAGVLSGTWSGSGYYTFNMATKKITTTAGVSSLTEKGSISLEPGRWIINIWQLTTSNNLIKFKVAIQKYDTLEKQEFEWDGGNTKLNHFLTIKMNSGTSIKIHRATSAFCGKKPELIIFGDSIVDGSANESTNENWTTYIKSNSKMEVALSGNYGDDGTNMVDRFITDVRNLRPQYALIFIGTNSHGNTSVYGYIAEYCKKYGVTCLFAHPTMSPSKGTVQIEKCNAVDTIVSEYNLHTPIQFDIATSIDYDRTKGGDTSLFKDNLHPNAQGLGRMNLRLKADMPFLF